MTALTLPAARSPQGKDAGSEACSARERQRTWPCVGSQAPDRGDAGDGATLTLGELVGRAWEGLHRPGGVTGIAACPVCGGAMIARSAGASCADCGSRLW